MSITHACCSTPPVVSDYTPVGTIEHLDNLAVYTVGPKDAKKAVLVFYDIFGFHDNTKQFCDILAKKCGWRVVLPDFFCGDYFDFMNKGGDKAALYEWIQRVASYEIISGYTRRVTEQLKKDGAEEGAFVGFCWGAKTAVQLNAEMDFYVCSACIHPSLIDNEDAKKVKTPILYINSQDEPDMTEYFGILKSKPIGEKCKLVVFDDIHHGFCAARGDYKDEHNVKRANEAIQLTIDYFTENFK